MTREDLHPGCLVAQACHATRALGLEHPNAFVGESLVVLAAKDTSELERYARDAERLGPTSVYHEEDLDYALTAFATTHAARRLLSSLPLAFKHWDR